MQLKKLKIYSYQKHDIFQRNLEFYEGKLEFYKKYINFRKKLEFLLKKFKICPKPVWYF